MQKIVVDPITRIEGHLRVEVIVDDENVVTDAYAGSTLWRGIETIVKGRDPRDVGFMTQRICGVCTYSHYRAGIEAAENALGIVPPKNAKLTRTLMNAALFMHDHCVHFYQLHGLDFVDVVSALSADPAKAEQEALKWCDKPFACGVGELKAVQEKLKGFVDKGELGIFANAYWGHKTYRFSPEQNLIALSHYLECLKIQRIAAQLMAIFGAKQPHPQSLTVGGVTCVMDILDPARIGEYKTKFLEISDFIHRAYLADIKMAAAVYKNEPSVMNDVGVDNFMCSNEFYLGDEYLFKGGIVTNMLKNPVLSEVDESKITEEATRAWYKNDKALHPYDGEQEPNYTGLVDEKTLNHKGELEDSKVFDMNGKYSWIKAPRYDNLPVQVGPIATIIVNYLAKNPIVVKEVDALLAELNIELKDLLSTLGRTAARMLEVKIISEHALKALDSLIQNLKVDQSTCAPYVIDKNKEYKGRFIGNAPRGVLSHWIRIKDGIVQNYQCVVPSTWNASPKDANGVMGSYEACLIGLKIADLTKPLEIIRKIHSYDPCIACAVHVMDKKGNKLGEYKVGV